MLWHILTHWETYEICGAMQRKEPYVGKIKIEFCIACSREYSAGHFGTIFDGVIANSVIQNMPYEKQNLLIKLISKFYIQLLSTTKT